MTELMQISSLEKVLPKNEAQFDEIYDINILKNEECAYQIAFKDKKDKEIYIQIQSDIKDNIKVYSVGNVPVNLPTYPDGAEDDNYISTEPGIFPEIVYPSENNVVKATGWFQALWIRIDKNAPVGKHTVKVILKTAEEEKSKEISVEILPIELEESGLIFTQWFHADCIARYYNVKTWSEKHWELTEKFVKRAADNGINMILTPIFTPPLDVEEGGERPTVQLVKITKDKDKYSFDFSLLDRWINMCQKNGIKYFEMAHLFTQWGARFTPKIMVNENGKEKRMFGWDVSAIDERYKNFLGQFLPALAAFVKEKGVSEVTYFHISDEPDSGQLDDYLKAKNEAEQYLKGFKIIDALSHYEFYKRGVVKNPVVALNNAMDFYGNTDNLWVYYCCAQYKELSNRFIAMPSYRNRSIGMQLFKFNVKGFLQWGYNFYYSRLSKYKINPFLQTDAGGGFPSGDAFSVYPGGNGPIDSLRIQVFFHALQDLYAMKMLEKHIGYEKTLKIIEDIFGEISFDRCARNGKVIIDIRNAVNNELKKVYGI